GPFARKEVRARAATHEAASTAEPRDRVRVEPALHASHDARVGAGSGDDLRGRVERLEPARMAMGDRANALDPQGSVRPRQPTLELLLLGGREPGARRARAAGTAHRARAGARRAARGSARPEPPCGRRTA